MPSGMSMSSADTSAWKYRSRAPEVAASRFFMAPSEPIPRYALYCLPLTKISSPGLSSHPAKSDPTITVSAPATMALAMSPEYCNPPSPMTGTPAARQACAAS